MLRERERRESADCSERTRACETLPVARIYFIMLLTGCPCPPQSAHNLTSPSSWLLFERAFCPLSTLLPPRQRAIPTRKEVDLDTALASHTAPSLLHVRHDRCASIHQPPASTTALSALPSHSHSPPIMSPLPSAIHLLSDRSVTQYQYCCMPGASLSPGPLCNTPDADSKKLPEPAVG